MRILVAPQAGSLGLGGLSRCRAIVREAAIRGHHVAVLCRSEVMSWFSGIAETAFEIPVPHIRGYGSAPNFRLADSVYIRGMDESAYVVAAIATELAAYTKWRPDVVFTENQFTVAVSARIARIPYVATAASANLGGFSSPLYMDAAPPLPVELAYNGILDEHGLDGAGDIGGIVHNTASLNIAPTLHELEPALHGLPNIAYVGPILDSSIELGELPRSLAGEFSKAPVYVYLSVGVLEPEDFLPVLAEVSQLSNHSFWVATRRAEVGGRTTPFSVGGVHVFDRLPGLTLMKVAKATIVRSGQNALMAAALVGRPVIGFAGHSAEADFNLRSLAEYEEVIGQATEGFNPTRLMHLLETLPEVNEDSAYIKLGHRLRAAGGVHATISAIEAL